jgi:hypothetical protein
LIFRIELLILIDELSAHRTPPANETSRLRGLWGPNRGDVCELLHTSIKIILMETIKDLYISAHRESGDTQPRILGSHIEGRQRGRRAMESVRAAT